MTLKDMGDIEKAARHSREAERRRSEELEKHIFNVSIDFVSGKRVRFEKCRFFIPIGPMENTMYLRDSSDNIVIIKMDNVEMLSYKEIEETGTEVEE